MRIERIVIHAFAPFAPQTIEFNSSDQLLTVAGPNGSGKSRLMNLIGQAAGVLGVGGRGYQTPEAGTNTEVYFNLSDEAEGIEKSVWALLQEQRFPNPSTGNWDGTVRIHIKQDINDESGYSSPEVSLGGIDSNLTHWYQQAIRDDQVLRFASIDASRSYSQALSHQAIQQARDGSPFVDDHERRRQWSSSASEQVFTGWSAWLARLEQEEIQRVNSARIDGRESVLADPFPRQNALIDNIFPGLRIKGSRNFGTLLFGRGEYSVPFQDLSGGEREVIFLLTLADSLAVRNGVLVIDEPELHLHPRLLRQLLRTIVQISENLQLIVCSHSYDAAEFALSQGTLLTLTSTSNGSVAEESTSGTAYQQLVTILGTPGLGLGSTLFVAVEGGADSLRAPIRFEMNTRPDFRVVFLRAGKFKQQLVSLMDSLQSLATSRGEPLSLVGVIDGDYSSVYGSEVNGNLLALEVHEVENYYLEPVLLDSYVGSSHSGLRWLGAEDEIRSLAKRKAGSWVYQYSSEHHRKSWEHWGCTNHLQSKKSLLADLTWLDFTSQSPNLREVLSDVQPDAQQHIYDAIRVYQEVVDSTDVWKHCKGKSVLKDLAVRLGFSGNSDALEADIDRHKKATNISNLAGWSTVQDFLDTHLQLMGREGT